MGNYARFDKKGVDKTMKTYKPVALIILDGWGIREKEDGNALRE